MTPEQIAAIADRDQIQSELIDQMLRLGQTHQFEPFVASIDEMNNPVFDMLDDEYASLVRRAMLVGLHVCAEAIRIRREEQS